MTESTVLSEMIEDAKTESTQFSELVEDAVLSNLARSALVKEGLVIKESGSEPFEYYGCSAVPRGRAIVSVLCEELIPRVCQRMKENVRKEKGLRDDEPLPPIALQNVMVYRRPEKDMVDLILRVV